MRGKLVKSVSSNENVACYLAGKRNRKALIIINKQEATKAAVTLSIPGFSGKGTLKQLNRDNAKKGPSSESITVTEKMKLTVPAYSLTSIIVE